MDVFMCVNPSISHKPTWQHRLPAQVKSVTRQTYILTHTRARNTHLGRWPYTSSRGVNRNQKVWKDKEHRRDIHTFTEDRRGLLAKFRNGSSDWTKTVADVKTSPVSLKKSHRRPLAPTWHHQDNPLYPVSKISFWFCRTPVQNVNPPTGGWLWLWFMAQTQNLLFFVTVTRRSDLTVKNTHQHQCVVVLCKRRSRKVKQTCTTKERVKL